MKLLFIQFAVSSASHETNQTVKDFITAFDDKTTLEEWIDSREIKNSFSIKIFKEIVIKVRDVLDDTKTDLESLIMNTFMELEMLCFAYFETYIILKSIQRIFWISFLPNTEASATNNIVVFTKKILFDEYDNIYADFNQTTAKKVLKSNKINLNGCFMSRITSLKNRVLGFLRVNSEFLSTIDLIQLSNNMIDSILPTNTTLSIDVKASFLGFEDSKMYFSNIFLRSFKIKPKLICTKKMLQYEMECSAEQSLLNHISLQDYTDKTFFCNKTATKFLITLFHFYSQIREKNTEYKISLIEDNKYQIKWFYPSKQPIEKIKKYWMQKEITNPLKRIIIEQFALMSDYDIAYSMIKSDNTEDMPISTRLVLLSCGHLLGFEAIDEFLIHYHIKDAGSAICHICRVPVCVIGSQDADVYRCKDDKFVSVKN